MSPLQFYSEYLSKIFWILRVSSLYAFEMAVTYNLERSLSLDFFFKSAHGLLLLWVQKQGS